MSKILSVPCSNCMTPLRLDLRQRTVAYSAPASGRGAKRVPARVVVEDVRVNGHLLLWAAPCCEDYEDSLELG